ncbi:MAG: hypothetical protein IJ475_00335 [Bacilli bacterium]|nr:hypothetical protein [Bacilli bacterium]
MKERKKTNKNNQFFAFFREHKKIRLFTIVFGVCFGSFFLINFGRYVKNIVENHFLTTQKFYFNSNKLTVDNKNYVIDHWSGVDSYLINVSMDSLNNNLMGADSDIAYNISCVAETGVDCNLSKNSGVIDTDDYNDSFEVNVVPNTSFKDGDEVTVNITAEAISPYTKTLSASFTFVVGSYGITYKIEDAQNQVYLNSAITNAKDYYNVVTAFGSYSVGDRISRDDYSKLSDTDKAKCAGAIITLSFDPNKYKLDLTNPAYLNNIGYTTTNIDGYKYVNSITFSVDPETSTLVKFYKMDVSKDNTYPITNGTPVINFSSKELE